MPHILDRPVWSALHSEHAHLAEGSALAKRYAADVMPFAATASDDAKSEDAFAALAAPEDRLLQLVSGEAAQPGALEVVSDIAAVQMLSVRRPENPDATDIEPLGMDDMDAMYALATLTKPGPFSMKSQSLGRFWGIRAEGRLVAMAGERLRQTDYTELSGICTHPDFQGRGLARRLSLYVTDRIYAQGKRPYLHSYADNAHAIALYEKLGYETRADMRVVISRLPD